MALLRLFGRNKKTGNNEPTLIQADVTGLSLTKAPRLSEAATTPRAGRGTRYDPNSPRLSCYFFFLAAFFLAFFLAAMMSSFGLWLRDLQGSQGPEPPDTTARCHMKKTVQDCLFVDSGQGRTPGTAGG